MFTDNLKKMMLDAKKLGVMDSKAEMLITDFLKTVRSEIIKKSEAVQRTMGEITALKKQEEVWASILRNHIRLETDNQKREAEREQRDCDFTPEIKKPTKKVKSKGFVGDKSKK